MLLRLRFTDAWTQQSWLLGLLALYSVSQRMERGEEHERKKLDWLLQMFRQVGAVCNCV